MHVAAFCPPFASHVAAFDALAAALAERGVALTLIQRAEVARFLEPGSALGFAAIDEAVTPQGSLDTLIARAARPGGPLGIRRVVQDMAAGTEALCRAAPDLLKRLQVDAVIGDQLEPAGHLTAARLGLPFASLAAAVPIDLEPTIPLPMLGFRHDPSARGIRRNAVGLAVSDRLLAPLHRRIAAIARAWGLGERWRMQDCLSDLIALWQMPAGLDFPRLEPPPHAHAVGPLRPREAAHHAPGLDLRGGRPLVYVSLGTLQGHRLDLLRRIARGCRRLGAEVVVTHCRQLTPDQAATIEADHVEPHVDQRAVIARADLVVTHGGLNTVLDAAEAGVPVLCLPIAFDQPGVAARVEAAGLGLSLDHRLSGSRRIERTARRLLGDPSYRAAAARLGAEIRAAGGAPLAAALVDRALRTGRPLIGAAA